MEYSKILEKMDGEPSYRIDQVKQAIFLDFLDNWDDVTWLPKTMRENLKEVCSLKINADATVSEKDGTTKTLIELSDGEKIEAVLMRHKGGRNTVCVSTQVGCPMRCAFCSTGKMGLTRNLTSDEMIEQVVYFARQVKKQGERIASVVYMGMGEPLLNYDNVLESIRIMNEDKGLNIGVRHFSISTCGIIDGIRKLTKEKMDVNLAISLHASNDEVRKKLMPIAQAHSLEVLLETIDTYIKEKGRKVMFEYLMIDGENDLDIHAHELAQLMKRKLCMVNLIPYNPTGGFRPSPRERVEAFRDILQRNGVEVTVRHRFGGDIDGACGQLATKGK